MGNDPRFDVELQRKSILDLAHADGIARFFSSLRYDTSARTVQTAGALGISEAVARPIRRIELLADRDLFQVYLFELTSVTVKTTRELVRSFRDRAGNFLLVLTSDYERIDFVLVDRLPAEFRLEGIAVTSVPVRPRVLTMERRIPSTVAVRVLRRFTWTENDGFAQFEKIRSAYSIAEWSEEEGLFNNRALFSDHYLKHRLREDRSWNDDPTPAFRGLRDIYLKRGETIGSDEDTLRKMLLEPVLDTLGFHAKAVRRDADDVSQPDYELYASDGDEKPIALCLTYSWERYLDGKDEARDRESPNENPGAVVVSLLQKRDVPWVIVTNGRLWRLYAKRTHSRATSFYEIDLEEVLAEATARHADPFRYFWLLFRRQAFELVSFTREEREERVPFLDRLLLESEDYAKGLGERLKERVFERVFPYLASGFISRWKGEVTEPDLLDTYRATLTLLYRLLFILFAEARDLLPAREIRGYYGKSLEKLKKDVAEAAGGIEDEIEASLKKKLAPDSTELYERVAALFSLIDRGSSDLNVPFYNGGLFVTDPAEDDESDEAKESRFLRDHAVPDRELAAAIDLLARDTDPRTQERVFVDYKSLGVRHLGSIYEGLLEFRLRFATERLGLVREKTRDVYKPWREIDESKRPRLERDGRFVRKGELYLENDKHERKATGSYYTPDYIVKYIVEHAVGPVVSEKLEVLRPKLREAQRWHREAPLASKAKGETVQRNYDWGPVVQDRWGNLVDEVFDIKVLDPAMGSGHFLVEAVDFITDRILDFLNAFPWNPVTAHLRYTRETILKEMERQGITIDPARLTDVNLLKRHVLKRCIYGVDLNPMAVELAKVSLWLDSFTLGAPLSFLDHHLRCGNSLVGVTVEEVEKALSAGTQKHLFSGNKFQGVKNSIAGMVAIGGLPDITADQVKHSRSEYQRAMGSTRWAKRLLDVYTSQWFGNEVVKAGRGKRGAAERNPALEFLGDKASEIWAERDETKLAPDFQRLADTAVEAAEEHRFFHWELEFPEVFYRVRVGTLEAIERMKSVGFDAVVGNPPYVGFHGTNVSKTFLDSNFRTFRGKVDVYVPFWERGLAVTAKGGRVSFICPSGFTKRDHGAELREQLAAFDVESFHDFEHYPVFEGALNYTCIPVIVKRPAPATLLEATFGADFERAVRTSIPRRLLTRGSWLITRDLPGEITSFGGNLIALGDVVHTLAEGIVTGKNDVFLVSASESLKIAREPYVIPALRGQCVDRYLIRWDETLLIYPYVKVDSETVPVEEAVFKKTAPSTYSYLSSRRDDLKGREWFDNSSKRWFELWNQRHISHQRGRKIVIQENSVRMECAFDFGEYAYLDTCCGITLPEGTTDATYFALLAVLNSAYVDRIFRALSVPKAEGHFIHKPMFLRKIPLPRALLARIDDLPNAGDSNFALGLDSERASDQQIVVALAQIGSMLTHQLKSESESASSTLELDRAAERLTEQLFRASNFS